MSAPASGGAPLDPTATPPTTSEHVLVERRGRAGVITLNRPEALNALTHPMVQAMAAALDDFATDPEVAVVVLTGAGERALCAGGDVVGLQRDALAGGVEGARFWADEYALNLAISRFPKPYVALMHGIVLGGGIGVSAHGSHRVVTDSTRVGMPETGIGFVPDVGGSWLLAHAPGHLGTHLALTGQHVGPGEAIACGLADVQVPADDMATLLDTVCRTGSVAVIDELAVPPVAGIAVDPSVVEEAYDHDTIDEVLAALDRLASGEDAVVAQWASDAAARIRRNSPIAVAVTLESLRRARGQSLAEALATEWRVSMNMQRGHDFVEGVRAQLVDKDRTPHWQPASLDEVDEAAIEAVFAPVDDPRISPPEFPEEAPRPTADTLPAS